VPSRIVTNITSDTAQAYATYTPNKHARAGDPYMPAILSYFGTCLQWRTDGGGGVGFQPRPPKFLSFDKAEPNSQFRGKYIHNNLTRIRVSLICKLSGTPH
jgi:hypothetical protein